MTKRYSDLKLKYKITIVMATLLMILFLAATMLFLRYFRSEYEKASLQMASEWSEICASRLEQVWDPIEQTMLWTITDPMFAKELINMRNDEDDLINKVNLQQFLDRIAASSPLIESVYITTDKGKLINRFTDYPKNNSEIRYHDYLSQNNGVKMLESNFSPFKYNTKVIPVICAMKEQGDSNILAMSQEGNSEFILAILLKEEEISKLLQNSTSQFDFQIQLISYGKEVLSDRPQRWTDTIVINTPTAIPHTILEMRINADSFMPMQYSIIKFSLFLQLLVSCAGAIAIFLISKRLTNPFQKITRMLERIKDNTYQFEAQAKYNDETGELITGINDMYSTILENMEVIRKTENEKFQYLSKMLTEQINPHFIYNTLEMINMEIRSGNLDNASNMINYFAMYLRTTLNNGEDLNTIAEQTRNVEAYFRIMNARLNGSINLNIHYPEELANVMIPKSIMQPIVENAIKHGFDYARNISNFILPEIDVEITGTESEIVISIYDNGMGMDVEKTEKLMLTDEKKAHLGISNIYKRLRIYDPESNVEIISVPYFRNEFKITFHPEVHQK